MWGTAAWAQGMAGPSGISDAQEAESEERKTDGIGGKGGGKGPGDGCRRSDTPRNQKWSGLKDHQASYSKKKPKKGMEVSPLLSYWWICVVTTTTFTLTDDTKEIAFKTYMVVTIMWVIITS